MKTRNYVDFREWRIFFGETSRLSPLSHCGCATSHSAAGTQELPVLYTIQVWRHVPSLSAWMFCLCLHVMTSLGDSRGSICVVKYGLKKKGKFKKICNLYNNNKIRGRGEGRMEQKRNRRMVGKILFNLLKGESNPLTAMRLWA